MNLDPLTIQLMTALVVIVSGVLFILDTLLRRDEGAGRVWALGFLSAMITTLAYLIWAQLPEAWWTLAAGNATFVAGTGCMWLGCRIFNGRRMGWSSSLVALAVLAALGSVLVEGPSAGGWAGALFMFVPLLAFAGAGAIECVRGAMRDFRTAWVLGAVLAAQSLFYVGRTAVFIAQGPDSQAFQTWFGTTAVSCLTISLTIVAVVVTSVLRASRAPMRGYLQTPASSLAHQGITSKEQFDIALSELAGRAQWRSEVVGVISVRIDDLHQISTAFGSEVARAVTDTWRAGVRRNAPSNSFVADDGQTGLLVGTLVDSPREARRQAAVLYRGLFDDLGKMGGGVIPVVGVGVSLSDETGYDVATLIDAARETARRAATSVESSVLVGESE